jgi:predicted nucleotide-binding protein
MSKEGNIIYTNNKDKKKVFIIHGRNSNINDSIFNFLRTIGLNPIEWSQAIILTNHPSPYIRDVLSAAFDEAQALVVLLTPDDIAILKEEYRTISDPDYEKEPTPQARPNVLFEAGMAFGRNPERTIIVQIGELRPFSDIAGIHILKLNNSASKRKEFVDRLKCAGCTVDTSGTDWFRTGNFENVQNTPEKELIDECQILTNTNNGSKIEKTFNSKQEVSIKSRLTQETATAGKVKIIQKNASLGIGAYYGDGGIDKISKLCFDIDFINQSGRKIFINSVEIEQIIIDGNFFDCGIKRINICSQPNTYERIRFPLLVETDNKIPLNCALELPIINSDRIEIAKGLNRLNLYTIILVFKYEDLEPNYFSNKLEIKGNFTEYKNNILDIWKSKDQFELICYANGCI